MYFVKKMAQLCNNGVIIETKMANIVKVNAQQIIDYFILAEK